MNDDTNEVRPEQTGSAEAAAGPEWKPVSRASTYELVIDAVEEQIMTGSLGVGDPLPAERDLAMKLGVSRASVREALRVLDSLGVVRSSGGSGRGAGTFIAAMPSAALTRFLRLHVALTNFSIDDVTETRIQLERSSAILAATRADKDALAEVNAQLAMMDTPGSAWRPSTTRTPRSTSPSLRRLEISCSPTSPGPSAPLCGSRSSPRSAASTTSRR